ncbi:Regulator of G-protein signaling 12 [Armadillidium vulgare]|nr:Regulator of G-protein signaling 12 [Armadillidium vulgare]
MLLLWCKENSVVRSLTPLDSNETDKTVYVMRGSGEFGFRIHGSRPVVVSAIESATPAETSGLEVGDIVMSINDINVLDASHSDVVRLAHSGSDTLRLDVARTCDVLTPLVTNDPTPVCAGYLYKLGGAHHMPGSNVITRKWRRRWFALKKDRCLYYYKSEMDQTPLGAVHLLDYSVHALSNGGRPYAFTIAKFRGTTLHLAARTEDARNRWGQMVTQAALEASQMAPMEEKILCPKDACLFFYYDTDATSAIGVVHLHGYRVQSTSIAGKKFAFELIPPDPRYRHFYLHTDSDSDKKRWMAGFEYSIDRWIKAG